MVVLADAAAGAYVHRVTPPVMTPAPAGRFRMPAVMKPGESQVKASPMTADGCQLTFEL